MNSSLRSRFQFFFGQAGYRVGYRAAGALALAKAEAVLKTAQSAGLVRVRWEDDSCPDLSWLDQPEFQGYEVREVLGCILEVRCPRCGGWNHLTSLWGITDPDSAYLIEIEAELALEELEAINEALSEVAA